MNKIYSYKGYQALQSIYEAIEDILQNVGEIEASQIKDLVNSQDEIFKKYDLPSSEIDNIKNSVEDSIRVKLGIDFS